MPDDKPVIQRTTSVEARVDAIQSAFDARGLKASEAVEELGHKAQEEWIPKNGARVVARAWVDPAYKQRMLTDDAKTQYKDRAATVEWANALLRQRGLQRLRVRGLAKARAVLLWFVLAHNLMQAINLRQARQVRPA